MSTLSLSRLFSKLPSDNTMASHYGNSFSQTLTFHPSSHDPNLSIIQREGHHGDTLPLFSITAGSKPDLVLSRIGAGNSTFPPIAIGTASCSSLSSTVDISLGSQSIRLKRRHYPASWVFKFPPLGKFSWENSGSMSTKLTLKDRSGQKLARFTSGGSKMPHKSLEILVPCDDYTLDLIVVTAMGVARMSQKEDESSKAILEVVSSIAGA